MSLHRAFLVEDNPLIRETLIPALQELAEAEVLEHAVRESETLEWLARHAREIEIVILLEGSGLGVLEGIRERGIAAVVVVLTNHATQDMRIRCAASGAQAFFDKARENEESFN